MRSPNTNHPNRNKSNPLPLQVTKTRTSKLKSQSSPQLTSKLRIHQQFTAQMLLPLLRPPSWETAASSLNLFGSLLPSSCLHGDGEDANITSSQTEREMEIPGLCFLHPKLFSHHSNFPASKILFCRR